MIRRNRVVVTGMGVLAPNGIGVDAFWKSLVAGESGITVDAVTQDRNEPRACWFWIVADNLRIAAENAVEVARESL